MKLVFQEERDEAFAKACFKIRNDSRTYMSIDEISELARNSPTPYLFTSRQNIFRMIRGKNKDTKLEDKYKLYEYVQEKYKEVMAENPNLRPMQAVDLIAAMPAPCYFISHKTAKMLLYRLYNEHRIR